MPICVQVMLSLLFWAVASITIWWLVCVVLDAIEDIQTAEEMRRNDYAIGYIEAKIKVFEARKDLYQYLGDMTAVARLMDTYDYEEANKMWDSLYIVYNSARW